MKKLALLFCAFSAFSAPLAAADPNPLYEELSRKKEVKVFVALPTDPAATHLNIEAFKKAVEDALKDRKSIRFTPVTSEAEADLVVESEIKEFKFSLTDPLDMLAGVVMAAADAANVAHFAAMDTHYTVREPSGKVRWDGVIHASLTDETFTEEEARERILTRSAEMLVRGVFGKKKND